MGKVSSDRLDDSKFSLMDVRISKFLPINDVISHGRKICDLSKIKVFRRRVRYKSRIMVFYPHADTLQTCPDVSVLSSNSIAVQEFS